MATHSRWPKAKFNLLWPYVYLMLHFHFSSDTVFTERFLAERQSDRNRMSRKNSEDADETRGPLQAILYFFSDVRNMIEYNRFTKVDCFIYTIHLLFMIFFFLVTFLFGALPQDRDPETGAYMDPVLRQLQLYNIFDPFKFQATSAELNRVMSLIILSSILVKFVAFGRHLRRARVNRHQYRNLNVVQLNVNYITCLFYDARQWISLVGSLFSHKCNTDSSPVMHNFDPNKKALVHLARIDRFYYHNIFDYGECHEHVVGKQSRDDERNQKLPIILKYLSREKIPDLLVPEPRHRIDIQALAIIVNIYLCTILIFSVFVLVTLGQLCVLSAEEVKNTQDWQPTLLALLYLTETSFLCTIISINGNESGLTLGVAIFCWSRTNKLIRIIRTELKVHQTMKIHFAHYLDEQEVKLSESLNSELQHSSGYRVKISDQHISVLAKAYRKKIDSNFVKCRNQNLIYLANLIEALKQELTDAKKSFSNTVNIMTVFGICSSTLIFSVFKKAEDSLETLMTTMLMSLSALPLLFSLIAGALVELVFRKVCKMLHQILGDELYMVEIETAKSLNKQLEHFCKINNRSFVLFANFAITFGSIFTIIGWIANAYPLLLAQGFIS